MSTDTGRTPVVIQGNRNRNDKQLELNACMLAPTPLLICQPPTVVRKRSRMAVTNSNWTTEMAVVSLSGGGAVGKNSKKGVWGKMGSYNFRPSRHDCQNK